jgi:hypothetical protein
LRKSKAGLLLVLAAAGLLAARPCGAQSVDLSVNARGPVLYCSLLFHWPHTAELVDSLRRGLESRITFTVRLNEQRRAAIISRDRLIAEVVVSRSVFWDFLDGVFVVEQDGGKQWTYTDDTALLAGLFSFQEVFPYSAAIAARPVYVSARAQFEPVRLMPPLTLVSMLGAASIVATPWIRRVVQ